MSRERIVSSFRTRFVILCLSMGPASLLAQPYTTVSSVIASGGGSTTVGPYTLTSTIGQTFAAQYDTAGSYSNAAGFWSQYGASGGASITGTFNVITVQDSVEGSLRAAIDSSNAAAGTHLIAFNIPGGGVHTITLHSPLPAFTSPVVIDGYTQPGASPNTNPVDSGSNAKLMVELDGSQAGYLAFGIHLSGGNSKVRGLIINRFTSSYGGGILIDGQGGDIVEGNFIGTDSSGTTGLQNFVGVRIQSTNNRVGGTTPASRNVICGNFSGVYLAGDTGVSNFVQGNYIGSTATGKGDLSLGSGIWIESSGNMIGGPDSSVRNVILGNSNPAVYLAQGHAGGNTIEGNYVGTNAAGNAGLSAAGVDINTSNNLIKANLVSGGRGIHLESCSGNIVQGNLIGLTADGTAVLTPNGFGINLLYAAHTLVGGLTPDVRNVVSVADDGVSIAGGDSNTVQGNYIGTNSTGTAALISGGAAGSGVTIASSYGNIIGGESPGARNVIANAYSGIAITSGSTANIVSGNYIGTNAAGTASLGNSARGLALATPSGSLVTRDNLIGGTTPTAANVISGNAGSGIYISGASHNSILGNLIGLAADGVSPLPNKGDGITLGGDSNSIGGMIAGAGNHIAFNGVGFVDSRSNGIRAVEGIGNAILGNSIYWNYGIGINLAGGTELPYIYVTLNDSCDSDSGPNLLQNYPVLRTATYASDTARIDGMLNSAANQSYRLEFFRSSKPDTDGYGGGQKYIGFATVNTDSTCQTSFSVSLLDSMTGSWYVSATATDGGGNTSEFSTSVLINGVTGVREASAHIPTEYRLEQNYPDPFNPSTVIAFQLPRASHVRLTVHNVLGQEVTRLMDGQKPPGAYEVRWDAGVFPSGVYFYRIVADGFVQTRKMILVR